MAPEPFIPSQVSVVIAVRSGMPFVQEAVLSALDQGPVLRSVVVVDDGSTDDTIACLREIGDPRLMLLSNPGRGVSAARNAGARETEAPWLLFLDADDRLIPGAIAALMAARTPDISLVYGDYERIDKTGRAFGTRHTVRRARLKPSGDVLTTLLSGNFIINGGVVLCTHEAFDVAGGFDQTLSLCEDWHLWCKLAALGAFAYLPKRVMDYRVHGTSVMMKGRCRIEDFTPALDAIFADKLVRNKVGPSKQIEDYRRKSEASLMTYCAQQAVRSRTFRRAAKMALGAMIHEPLRTPWVLSCVAGALFGF